MPDLQDLPHTLRPAAAEPAGALILMHGGGANERDMAMFVDVLDPQKRLVAACPRGTLETPATAGFQWYVDREPGFPQFDSFEGAFIVLSQWLELFAQETGVPLERTILGGFDQGATMAWGLTMARGRPRPGGVLALSGFIPRVADYQFEDAALAGLPVAIVHGTQDAHVPVDFGHGARDRAQGAGADVLFRESDVGHVLDLRVVPDLATWVGGRFGG
jgi:phospholipase/carboxylesterase